MLLYVGFPDKEVLLLRYAAERLHVTDQCSYVSALGTVDDAGHLIDIEKISSTYPSVIFLNLDGAVDHWKKTLVDMKSHPTLRGLPIVGLGRIKDEDVAELYNLRINSYIRKPDTFEEMVKTADIALKFWLVISQLPAKYLDER